jgi:hypothetical protein
MAQFKIGDRVKCINGKDHEPLAAIWTLKEGHEYIIQDVKSCCKNVYLNVGAIFQSPLTRGVCSCGEIYSSYSEPCYWFDASRFVKIQEQPRTVRIQMDMPEPILN